MFDVFWLYYYPPIWSPIAILSSLLTPSCILLFRNPIKYNLPYTLLDGGIELEHRLHTRNHTFKMVWR